jgi:hypothetical protein
VHEGAALGLPLAPPMGGVWPGWLYVWGFGNLTPKTIRFGWRRSFCRDPRSL